MNAEPIPFGARVIVRQCVGYLEHVEPGRGYGEVLLTLVQHINIRNELTTVRVYAFTSEIEVLP